MLKSMDLWKDSINSDVNMIFKIFGKNLKLFGTLFGKTFFFSKELYQKILRIQNYSTVCSVPTGIIQTFIKSL